MPPLPWPPGRTPYATPDQLYSVSGTVTSTMWPVGVQWSTIPYLSTGAPSSSQVQSVLGNICLEGTDLCDQIVNQPLRATLTTEELSGPNFRITQQWSSGNGRIIASRWPVIQVTQVQVSPGNAWPRQFTSLPPGSFEPEYPVDGLFGAGVPSAAGGGQGILFAPGFMGWNGAAPGWPAGASAAGWPGAQVGGRFGYRVSFTYISGWPHTCLTQPGTAGATQITVDDCTGWVLVGSGGGTIGAAGIVYDAMGGGQESIAALSASAVSGPGTLSLASPLAFAHGAGIAVSAMPQTIIWAAALLSGRVALGRGATSTTIQTSGGGRQVQATPDLLYKMAKAELSTYRRTI